MCNVRHSPAVMYALVADEGLEFLRLWLEGAYDEIRDYWPDCPAEIFSDSEPIPGEVRTFYCTGTAIECPHCHHVVARHDDPRGKMLKCNACSSTFTVAKFAAPVI